MLHILSSATSTAVTILRMRRTTMTGSPSRSLWSSKGSKGLSSSGPEAALLQPRDSVQGPPTCPAALRELQVPRHGGERMGPNERVKERRSPIGLLILSRFLQCSRGKWPGVAAPGDSCPGHLQGETIKGIFVGEEEAK